MVLSLFSRLTPRQFESLLSMLLPDGVIVLADLLTAEKELLKQFVLEPLDPALKRVALRKRLGKEISAEDELALARSEKVFAGRLTNNNMINNETLRQFVNDLFKVHHARGNYISIVDKLTSGGKKVDMTFLGESLSVINVSPSKLQQLVYRDIFDQPELVLDALMSLIQLKAADVTKPVFANRDALKKRLESSGALNLNDIAFAVEDLIRVEVHATRDALEAQSLVYALIDSARDLDKSFDLSLYSDAKTFLPMYHCTNAKWVVWFVSSFMGSPRQYLTPWITIDTLYAFYRKGVELIANR